MVTLVPFSSEKGLFSVEMIEEALSLSLSPGFKVSQN